MIKNVSAPCTSGYQELKFGPLRFNIISLQCNALSPSLFELFYPFKIEGLFLVPQVLISCLYVTFIFSILCTTKMTFQFWKQIEDIRSNIREYGGYPWRRISNPHSDAAVMAACNVWAGALSCNNRTPQVSFPHLFLTISWRSCLNSLA